MKKNQEKYQPNVEHFENVCFSYDDRGVVINFDPCYVKLLRSSRGIFAFIMFQGDEIIIKVTNIKKCTIIKKK